MNIYSSDKNLILENVPDFDIEEVLECGQCFHFTKLNDKEYEILALGKYLHIKQENSLQEVDLSNRITLYNTSIDDYEMLWKDYFDMDRDYHHIKNHIVSIDDRLADAVAAKKGVRIIKQEFFETLISFIISQNKQIPHIKQIVHTISERYGDEIVLPDGRKVYSFPTVEKLYQVSEEELRECKVGFRAPYIRNAVEKVYDGEIDGLMLQNLSVSEARERLMTIKGVGEKVANCVLLFGLGFTDVFPVDVWMKRIMEHMYFGQDTKKEIIEKFAMDRYGEYAGFAQQYLFYYGREQGLGK